MNIINILEILEGYNVTPKTMQSEYKLTVDSHETHKDFTAKRLDATIFIQCETLSNREPSKELLKIEMDYPLNKYLDVEEINPDEISEVTEDLMHRIISKSKSAVQQSKSSILTSIESVLRTT